MSHWMRISMQVEDLETLERACKNLGLSMERKEMVSSRWAGDIDSVASITDAEGGAAAVVKKEDGYELSIDEYQNSLVSVVGRGCSLLTREYTVEAAKKEIANVGLVQSTNVQEDGSVVLTGIFI